MSGVYHPDFGQLGLRYVALHRQLRGGNPVLHGCTLAAYVPRRNGVPQGQELVVRLGAYTLYRRDRWLHVGPWSGGVLGTMVSEDYSALCAQQAAAAARAAETEALLNEEVAAAEARARAVVGARLLADWQAAAPGKECGT